MSRPSEPASRGGSRSPELTAYRLPGAQPLQLVPAARERGWMDQAPGSKRCLPLRIANEAGWWVINPQRFEVVWNGRADSLGVYEPTTGRPPRLTYLNTGFGHGILTVRMSYLFRTEPGWNLLARGPANLPKHGIQALEGLVETDWSTAPFTMNWKITAPDVPVAFEAGEPLCQIAPVRRGELESVEPGVEELTGEPLSKYGDWSRVRALHSRSAVQIPDVNAAVAEMDRWQGAYARGRFPNEEERFEEHQTRLRLKPFTREGGQHG